MSIIESLTDFAKQDLIKCVDSGSDFLQKGLFLKNELVEKGVIIHYLEENEKREAYKEVGRACASMGYDQIALLIDGRMKTPDMEYVSDVLIINYIDLKELDNNKFFIVPYEVKGKIVDFATPKLPDGASFGGQIIGCVIVGFFSFLCYQYIQGGSPINELGDRIFNNYFHNIKNHPELMSSIDLGIG